MNTVKSKQTMPDIRYIISKPRERYSSENQMKRYVKRDVKDVIAISLPNTSGVSLTLNHWRDKDCFTVSK
jgi:hypothetical protein